MQSQELSSSVTCIFAISSMPFEKKYTKLVAILLIPALVSSNIEEDVLHIASYYTVLARGEHIPYPSAWYSTNTFDYYLQPVLKPDV